MPLSEARRLLATPLHDLVEKSSTQNVDIASRDSSPDIPHRELRKETDSTTRPKQALTIDTTVAPTATQTQTHTTTTIPPAEDASIEPDFFQQLLDAAAEPPLSAEDVQTAQEILQAGSPSGAASRQEAPPEQVPTEVIADTAIDQDLALVETAQQELISAIAPRTISPFSRLRSNDTVLPQPTGTILPALPPPPLHLQRRSLAHAVATAPSASPSRPRVETVMPQSAPPQQLAFVTRTPYAQTPPMRTQASVNGGLSDQHKAALAQEFRETGGLGGLPLVLDVARAKYR